MNIRGQLRWGGMWIMIASALMNSMNILVYLGYHNTIIQAIYSIGFTGLILSTTVIHIAQAKRAGIFGLLGYMISGLSLTYANIVNFLTLADFVGIQAAHLAFLGIWNAGLRIAVYTVFLGMILLGISVAWAGVLPKWGGVLLAVGVALQLPAAYAIDTVGQLFYVLTIGGSILCSVGLLWIGWALWSGNGPLDEELGLSNLDRAWGAPFILFASLLLVINAYINSVPDLTLLDGVIHLISTTTIVLMIVILHTVQADHAGGTGLAGFFFTHLGSTLNIIPAYFIMAQLAGQLENNRLLIASWTDIPVGRFGYYLLLLGIFLFGVSVIRAEVFPRWLGWLVVIGLALSLPAQFAPQDYLFSIFSVIGATLEGVGLGGMGWTLLHRKSTKQVMQFNESTT